MAAKRFAPKKIIRWIRTNPFTSSIIFLVAMWFSLAYVVYIFEKDAQGANITTYWEGIWWGIVTIVTVGYGDRYPITVGGRIFAEVMMVGGVLGISIVTAKISSVFLEKALRERRGHVDASTLKGHFIVCGWKSQMETLLQHILDSNPGLTADKIVLVNNAPDSLIESIQDFPTLKKVHFVRGDFFSAEVLKRAAPERALKILIVADATPDVKGAPPTRAEADARTIMAAMTLSHIAKGTAIAAEILDAQMDQYLKLAHVHEIIYSRDYSRYLLALASTGTGVTNIFHELLDPHGPFSISTRPIPDHLYGKTFLDLKRYFGDQFKTERIIGILENSGNSHQAKELALKKAQQTPNIKQLVENLHNVKSLKFNSPVFNPEDNYPITEGSMAIVIRQREYALRDQNV